MEDGDKEIESKDDYDDGDIESVLSKDLERLQSVQNINQSLIGQKNKTRLERSYKPIVRPVISVFKDSITVDILSLFHGKKSRNGISMTFGEWNTFTHEINKINALLTFNK